MKRIRYLKGFRYFEIEEKKETRAFDLTAEGSPCYFKSEVLNKEDVLWNGVPVTLSADPDKAPPFDSGIVCSLSSNLQAERDSISDLRCFFAPYQLMAETIKQPDNYRKSPKKVHDSSIAVGIGMVLSIIATKGSSETGIQKPYMLFVNRGVGLGVRNGELDVPVVEGLNCSDFTYDGHQYTARLEDVVRRALEEERGLHCQMLESMGLLHMPQKYYLGYDKSYMQWNFFGTVVVDCTVEELVREGFYYTKDKFESSKVIAIPAEPQILYYHLSEKTLHKKSDKNGTAKRFWNTAWASVCFALRDYAHFYEKEEMRSSFEEKWFLMEKSFPALIEPARKAVNLAAKWFEKCRKLIEIGSGFFSIAAIALFIISALKADSYADVVNEISSLLMAVLTCWLAISLARRERISTDGVVEIGLDTITNCYLIPEIRVFRNVVLVDGNIGEGRRNNLIEHQRPDGKVSPVRVERKCKMFHDASTPETMWEMIESADNKEEHIKWVIKSDEHTSGELRIVFSYISRDRKILLRREDGKLTHFVDIAIPYREFSVATDADGLIQKKISEEVNSYFHGESLSDKTIQYKFLMKDQENFVLSGYVYLDDMPRNGEDEYPLSYDLTNTSFSMEMKDDITRVVCEYAVAEHIGYRMYG